MFENTIEASSLTVMTVTIKGAWVKTRPSDWRGIASADSSLVAVSFLRDPQGIMWCKSERGDPAGQEVRLLLGWYDKIGLDVQVNFGVGGVGGPERCFQMFHTSHLFRKSRSLQPENQDVLQLFEGNRTSTAGFFSWRRKT
jgi:hypothetical protein